MSPYRLRDGGTYKSLFVVERNTRVAVVLGVGQSFYKN